MSSSATCDGNAAAEESYQYRDSLSRILKGIILIAIFGGEKLRTSTWMPKSWQTIGEAVALFRKYAMDMIEDEDRAELYCLGHLGRGICNDKSRDTSIQGHGWPHPSIEVDLPSCWR